MGIFFKPLTDFKISSDSDQRKIALIWASVIIFLAIKITWGNASYFHNHFEHFFSSGYFQPWYKWIYHHLVTLFVFALFPMAIIKIFLKEKLSDYGIGPGSFPADKKANDQQMPGWKFGLIASLVSFLILLVPLYFSSKNTEHLNFYPLVKLNVSSPSEIVFWAFAYLPHYIGWEFFYRGYIGFGMKKHYGAFTAIMLQSLLTTLEHIGKPSGEIIGAIPAGIYLGLLTYRTNSIWWAVLFHWYLGVVNSIFCSL